MAMTAGRALSRQARGLRVLHSVVGCAELACLLHLWYCAIFHKRGVVLRLAVAVLLGEGGALLVYKGCPLGVFQRRAGDDVPMFELWFGRRLAPFAIPFFVAATVIGLVVLVLRRPAPAGSGETL